MKILKVIHGFPPDFMAGSEVYSHTLCQELSRLGHEIFIFTRIENEFLKSYEVIDEVVDSLRIRRINKPKDYSYNDKFYDENKGEDTEIEFEGTMVQVGSCLVSYTDDYTKGVLGI